MKKAAERELRSDPRLTNPSSVPTPPAPYGDHFTHAPISGIEFERMCANLLQRAGWTAAMTRGSGDQGADLIAEKLGVRLVLQCKYYNRPVGNKVVQEAIAARVYSDAQHAAVTSNNVYTPSAKQLAAKAGVHLLVVGDLHRIDVLLGLKQPERVGGAPDASGKVIQPCPSCRGLLRLQGWRTAKARCPLCGVSSWFST